MISKSELLLHYKKPEVQKEIVRLAQEKEAVGSYGGKGYGKRPDVLMYASDVLEFVKLGVSSFHISEETWNNPLRLSVDMPKKEQIAMRKGWDLVLDIDCQELEYSKIAAHYLVQAIEHQGIKSVTCKFSGNHGFHIAVPFEAFPLVVNGEETKTLFPEAPKRIATYLAEMIRPYVSDHMRKLESDSEIAKKSGKEFNELKIEGTNKFDPFRVFDIDTILISPRHLFRSVYSFNEKSGLVSIPIDPHKVLEFDKKSATSDKVVVNDKFKFLDREKTVRGEAENLFVQAFDYELPKEVRELETEDLKNIIKTKKKYDEKVTEKIPIDFFPPCINHILSGLKDGKKRSMFILINFLTSVGWDYESITDLMAEWNKRNDEPLRETLIKGHIRYHKNNKRKVMPPNCNNKSYYLDLRMCKPDMFCKYAKNPVTYSIKKARYFQKRANKEEAKANHKMTDEQKAKMKETRARHKKFKEEMLKKKEAEKESNNT